MKIECPCNDCTPETGRSLTCHNVETCERWANYTQAHKEQRSAYVKAKNGGSGPIWTDARSKRKANGPKYNTKRDDNFSKGW